MYTKSQLKHSCIVLVSIVPLSVVLSIQNQLQNEQILVNLDCPSVCVCLSAFRKINFKIVRMNRVVITAALTGSSASAFALGRRWERRSKSSDSTPADYFVRAKDNLITATVQQSIYRLGDPNVALSKVLKL